MAAPKAQLDGFIDKYSPAVAREGRAALRRLRRFAPGAVELVYDNYNLIRAISRKQRPRRPTPSR